MYPVCTTFHLSVSGSPHLSVFASGLCVSRVFEAASVCLQSVCLSVTPDFPSLSHNSHSSYTAAQPVEERWARCQPARAPVGQSISSIKDMLSTRVYPPGLEPWSPVRAPPCCPWTQCTESPSCFISMAPRHPVCCFRSLKTRTQINEKGAGNNYFLISSQAALLVRSLSLKGQGTRESGSVQTSSQFFLKEYKVSKVHLGLLQYKIDERFHRGLKGLFVSCYT